MNIKKAILFSLSAVLTATGINAAAVSNAEASMLLNRFTIGKSNVAAIDQAISCERAAALESLDEGMKSSISDYREVSYMLAAAVYYDSGHEEKVEPILELWRNEDDANKSGDEASFIEHAEHFAAYFAGERLEKTGSASCSVD